MQNSPININPNLSLEEFLLSNPQLMDNKADVNQIMNEDYQSAINMANELQPKVVAPDKTPEQEKAEVQESLRALQQARGEQVNPMQERSGNIVGNFMKNVQEIGTGLTNFIINSPEIISELPKATQEYFASGKNANDLILDGVNAVLKSYNIDLRTLDERTARDILGGIAQGIYENPADFILDVTSFGGAGLVKNLVKKVPGLSRAVKAGEVETRLAAENVEGATKLAVYSEKMKKAEEAAKAAGTDLEAILKAAEEGTKLPEGGKEAFKLVKDASKDYDEIIKYVSPETYRGMEETAINQKILRERLKSNSNITFEDVNRETRPLFDLINQDEYLEVLDLAKSGNKVAKEVVGAKALYDKGRLIPVTHVGAETLKGIDTTGKLADAIIDAGQFSTRVVGNSTYKAIADAIRQPGKLIDALSKSYLDQNVTAAILRGEMLGQGNIGKNVSYLNRQALEQGKLRTALESASKTPTGIRSVPIDNDYRIALRDQLSRGDTYLAGAAKDLYGTRRAAMLGGGTYVAGNIITGATNAVMNSGVHLIDDFINAIKSQGEITKRLGTYRYTHLSEVNTPVLKQINAINKITGKPLQYADKTVQNLWGEMAAHADLRRMGIAPSQRIDAISQMDKAKLGNIITDIRRTALINSPKTILPRELDAVANTISPFWRWLDTATQSNIYMLSKNPITANILMTDIAANIGFDRELQNRLNLNVSSDKPFVTYKFNDKTGRIEEQAIEFMPIMTSLKLGDANTYLSSGGEPAFGAIMDVIKGKNAYGAFSQRPSINGVITQTVGNKRLQVKPNGEIQEIQGMGDEILNQAVREFFAAPRLYNKTIAPLLAPILSPTGEFYQPYDMSMLGSFNPNFEGGNVVMSGNPAKPRSIGDVGRAMLTQYSRDYYPERGVTPNVRRQILRGYNKRMNRVLYEQ